jgi:hypothetical protein
VFDLSIPRLHRPIARYFRGKRFRAFETAFGVTGSTRILDLGGYEYYWSFFSQKPRVTIANLDPPKERQGGFHWVIADARHLPFRDAAFDVVFANSIVEHVPGQPNRQAFAEEIRRVGRRYYVQTPNRWFPVEPHLMTPLIHYLPRRWQRPLLRRFTVWGVLHKPTPQGCDEFLRDIQLLRRAEMERLFPGAEIWAERALGLVKSWIAVRLAGGPRNL